MNFEPLHCADQLHVVNPAGDFGIATLWTPIKAVIDKLAREGVDLSPETSRIAVFGQLRGNGIPEMLRNLLWNPQITNIVILGKDLSSSKRDLMNFFASGLEPISYLGTDLYRIRGTEFVLDGDVTPDSFPHSIKFHPLGELGDPQTIRDLRDVLENSPTTAVPPGQRQNIPLRRPEVQRFPSEPRNHTILRATPVEAWRELIFRIVRFGHPVTLAKGQRIELQNVKVVVEDPQVDNYAQLEACGFSTDRVKKYQEDIINPALIEGLPYTYGNRLRGYFPSSEVGKHEDTLETAIQMLRVDPQTRHAYISLWNTGYDLHMSLEKSRREGNGRDSFPCFVSTYFRNFEGRLTLTATFRTHNAMDAWLLNFYGLMAIQRFVASGAGLPPGPITVISHSISVNPAVMDRAMAVAKSKTTDDVVDPESGKRSPRFDANGEFAVTIDPLMHEIVVQHSYQGLAIGEYRGRTAQQLEDQIARDCAVSEISHALYLGREIALAEQKLRRPGKA